jgi:ornithine cyclodeaminase/alanine dehydrogenase-like protein (mu-crystallin family)
VNDRDAFVAVEGVFAAMAAGDAVNFPVVREAIGHADALYGFKSGFDRAGMALGVKSGGYWPQNMDNAGISNHQSSVFLFDPDTGRLQAIIGGNYLTAVRTAAAAAVSISHLARPRCCGSRHDGGWPSISFPITRRVATASIQQDFRLEPVSRCLIASCQASR